MAGAGQGEATQASDTARWAAFLFFLFTGRAPRPGLADARAVGGTIMTVPLVPADASSCPLRGVPRSAAAVVAKALAADPRAR